MDALKEKKLPKVIQWLKLKGFSNIKANLDGFEDPKAYQYQAQGDRFVPDATAIKFGQKCYFEVALKSEEVNRSLRKWKLLSALADMKNGTLYLFTPRGHKAFVERMVAKRQLNAEIISV